MTLKYNTVNISSFKRLSINLVLGIVIASDAVLVLVLEYRSEVLVLVLVLEHIQFLLPCRHFCKFVLFD